MGNKDAAKVNYRTVARRATSPGATRSWSSPLDPARAFGAADGRFYKIVSRQPSETARHQDARGEFDLLRRCRGVAGVSKALELIEEADHHVLVLQRVPGRPLSDLELGCGRLALTMLRLIRLVWALAVRGVRHNDLRPENVMVAPDGRIFLVDFDQASTGGLSECLLAGLGVPVGGVPVCNGLLAPLRERVQAGLSPRLIRALRGTRLRRGRSGALPALPADASEAARALHEAWRIAAEANASSPGRAIAYYELDFQGLRFPGERPWSNRWRVLRRATAYADRRVLELGCNLALLSIFALKERGAAAALAVDRDPEILAAAGRVALAFGVEPMICQVDFDRDEDWEERLEAFGPDVVVALSVLHWVEDKARLLAFLGRFDEVLFEGHDSSRVERARLRQAGFTQIDLVDTSERGRPILLACKR